MADQKKDQHEDLVDGIVEEAQSHRDEELAAQEQIVDDGKDGLDDDPEKAPPEEKPDSEKKGDDKQDPNPERKPAEEKPELTVEDWRKANDDLRKENETLDKRFKDNQANYTKEHQKALDLEKQLEGLQAKAKEADDWFDNPDDQDDQPKKKSAAETEALVKLNEKIDSVHTELQETRNANALRDWERAEAPLKEKHDDYETVVAALQTVFETDEALQKEFADKGATPEAAYEMGKRLADAKEMLADPEAYRKRIREEVENELKENFDGDGSGLPVDDPANLRSMPPDKVAGKKGMATSSEGVVDELFS